MNSAALWRSIKETNDHIWVLLGAYTLLPGAVIVAFKLYQLFKRQELVRSRQNQLVDWIFRIVFGFCFVYYIVDCLTIVFLGNAGSRCYQAFFTHHVFSFLGLMHVFRPSKPMFWQEVLVAVMHGVVLTFPKFFVLQAIYFCSFVAMAACLFIKPYSTFPQVQAIRKYVPPVLLSFGAMSYFDCLHLMDAVNAERT